MTEQKQQWGSRLGVILAVSGSAVVLGNFLRFPGNAAENGGGAFMIPYFLALLLLGIPIGWAEWTMGRYGGRKGFHSAPAILGVWAKGAVGRYLGVFGVLIPLGVYFYYVLIETWCLYYVLQYFGGALGICDGLGIVGTDPIEKQVAATHGFFSQVTGDSHNGALFFAENGSLAIHPIVWTFFLVAGLNIFFVFRGISKGIEAVCKAAMPIMAVLGIIILIRVLTLGTPDAAKPDQSVLTGLGYLWNPNLRALGDFKTWLAASGQIFFSLSVGFGVIINYSSYMKKKDDVVLSGLCASATNEFFEVALGGLITVTASVVFVGVALTSAGTGGTMSLGFKTLPMVFAQMPGGALFGGAFFLILFLAAITSSLSMLQPTKAFFEESLGVGRQISTTMVTAWGLVGNLFVLWYSRELIALDTIDFWVGTFFILVVAGVQIVAFGWVFGVDKGLEEAHQGANIRIPQVFRFIMKYVSPTFLLVVVVGFCINNVPGYLDTLFGDATAVLTAKNGAAPSAEQVAAFEANASDAGLTWILMLATIAGLVTITALGARRWRAQGLDLDGQRPLED